MARSWGIWTRGKLQILERYLAAFCTASVRSSARVYLDLFAGEPENVDRSSGQEIAGSARIALELANPPFTKLYLFELPQLAERLQERLEHDFPGRARVIPGDCNETIAMALDELREVRWAPTFAFIDPNGPDCHWRTLEQLAAHRAAEKTKVELWLLLPDGLFVRTLPIDAKTQVRPEDADRITLMYGTDDWRRIYEARLRGELDAAEARAQYVNLMRWRLESVLGYQWTHQFEVRNQNGVPIYHMVFATDHEAGTRIMSALYSKASQEFPAMRKQANQERRDRIQSAKGILSLFDAEVMRGLVGGAIDMRAAYKHEPPEKPFWES